MQLDKIEDFLQNSRFWINGLEPLTGLGSRVLEGILVYLLLYRAYFVEISHACLYRVNMDILEHN